MEKIAPIEVGYKVCRGKRAFRPATSDALQSVRYQIGEWTEQASIVGGPLAVFSSLEPALKFRSKYGHCVFKCEYVKSEETTLWKRLPPSFHGYLAVSNGITEKELENCPVGTVFATKVRLVEKIGE
jgi:hypothetical protein